mmetsp:Transcript_38603/g.73981  ORF Transcript_38603/g.73981 Transcript_38603/m.73981 type:complete len:254 (-) Transcript_38603:2315-3076(-)
MHMISLTSPRLAHSNIRAPITSGNRVGDNKALTRDARGLQARASLARKTRNVRATQSISKLNASAEGQETPMVSPFEGEAGSSAAAGLPTAKYDEINFDTVNAVLDTVRPYLIADGGNVTVMQVIPEAGIVSLKMEGACGSCPSSQETLKLGIEKALKDAFGDMLQKVQEVKDAPQDATVAMVDKFLDQLRPAIHNYKGTVEVTGIEDHVCNIKYKGPPMIAPGIKDAVQEHFKDLETVTVMLLPEDDKPEVP